MVPGKRRAAITVDCSVIGLYSSCFLPLCCLMTPALSWKNSNPSDMPPFTSSVNWNIPSPSLTPASADRSCTELLRSCRLGGNTVSANGECPWSLLISVLKLVLSCGHVYLIPIKQSLVSDGICITVSAIYMLSICSNPLLLLPHLWMAILHLQLYVTMVQLIPAPSFPTALWLYGWLIGVYMLSESLLTFSLGTLHVFEIPVKVFEIYFQSTLKYIHGQCFWPLDFIVLEVLFCISLSVY